MIPERITIGRIEDFHTHYVGKYDDDKIFAGFPFFAEASQQRPVALLHLFDKDGTHVNSHIWETGKMSEIENQMKNFIDDLPNMKLQSVAVKPFETTLSGIACGFIPDTERDCVTYQPYGLAFFPPWDGIYDT